MSKRLKEIVGDVYHLVMTKHCSSDYLDSVYAKYLYSEWRLRSLKQKITNYKRRVFNNNNKSFPDTTSIAMDFDHCVSCLRSSLEHLSQLINSVAELELQPLRTPVKDKEKVDMFAVIKKLKTKNKSLSKLACFLEKEAKKDWYKELNDLRIELYHNRIQEFLNLNPNNLDSLNELFLIPLDFIKTDETKANRDICYFCQNNINNIENVLYTSLIYLKEYLSAVKTASDN